MHLGSAQDLALLLHLQTFKLISAVCLQWPTQQHALRNLAATHLDWIIQKGSHDSKVDAIAALRLVKLKLQHGPFFGTSTVSHAQNLPEVLQEHGRWDRLPCHFTSQL